MDNAIVISFGPFWDVMFRIFLVAGIFAFAGITFQYLELEIRSWFGKKEDLSVEYEEDEKTLNYDDFVGNSNNAPVRAHYNILDDGTVVNNFSGEKVEPVSEEVITEPQNDDPMANAYLVQYGEYEDFSRRGRVDIIRTFEPRYTAIELIKKYEGGYIRWRITGDDVVVPDWHHIGFYTTAFAEDIDNVPLPTKEKLNG